jgi:hypothetical protein
MHLHCHYLKTTVLAEFKGKREDKFKHQHETHWNTLTLQHNNGAKNC